MRVLGHVGQRHFHRLPHAVFVDIAHVEHFYPQGAQLALFLGIHAADADLADGSGVAHRGIGIPPAG